VVLPAIDWTRPWHADHAAAGAAAWACVAEAGSVAGGLDALAGRWGRAGVPRFGPSDVPPGIAYEQAVFETNRVPTRENAHDFLNGLCWLRFPLAKRQLNRLQAAEIAAHGVGPVRGQVRDALTLFDENAALLQAPEPLWDALAARDWHRLFVTLRPWWARARLVLFGHALLEKLAAPYKSITAHVWREPVPEALGDDMARWDAWLATRLDASRLAGKPFTPLPVLGVPGWWAANETPGFYDDPLVFRTPRA